jgi:hypothetical protein
MSEIAPETVAHLPGLLALAEAAQTQQGGAA